MPNIWNVESMRKYLFLIFISCVAFSQTKGWNIETLKELEDEKIAHLKEITDLQFKLNQIALDKAEARMNGRLESLNEWRAQNKDERGSFATKEQVEFIEKLVYIGLGIVLTVQFLIGFYLSAKKYQFPNKQ